MTIKQLHEAIAKQSGLSLEKYSQDLNAMAKVRMKIPKKLHAAYTQHLEDIVARQFGADLWSWALLDASAGQHAQAYVRLYRLWKPRKPARRKAKS